MRILLTGASGFIGKYIVKKILNQKKHCLLTLSRSPIDISHPNLEWHKIDLTDHKKFKDILNFAPSSYSFSMAGYSKLLIIKKFA